LPLQVRGWLEGGGGLHLWLEGGGPYRQYILYTTQTKKLQYCDGTRLESQTDERISITENLYKCNQLIHKTRGSVGPWSAHLRNRWKVNLEHDPMTYLCNQLEWFEQL